jgi:glycosyltransferase domain-containing protein|tara:strand:- start:476 stop:1648 length:1173 start_codon:yes stop_codon:yes gene_type:complete
MKDNNLTLFLILKDRPFFTERLMQFMNFVQYPFKLIIADGGKDKEIQTLLEDKQTYPNVDYEYIRCPIDKTLDDFHEKMANTIDRIDTPITSVIDNDDLLIQEGYYKCLQFLKDNPGYSSARGKMSSMGVNHHEDSPAELRGVCGNLIIQSNMYSKYMDDIVGDTAKERFKDQTTHFHGNWHNLTRTNHVQACWKMLNVIKPENMRFTEQVTGYINTLWGDSHRGDFDWMLHENSQRIMTQGVPLSSHFPKQVDWLEIDCWASDFNKMTELMGVAISEYDDTPVAEAMDYFAETYPLKFLGSENEKHIPLFREKINEAKKLGYSEKRIEELTQVVRKYNIKDLPQVGDLGFSPLTTLLEQTLMANFLAGMIHQYNGTNYPLRGKLLSRNN